MTDKTNNQQEAFLSTIDEKLSQDKDGEYLNTLQEQFFNEATRLKALKDQGASPEDFARIDASLAAVVAAAEVVDKSWKKHHQNS